jgi:hypothetical protein
VPLDALVIAPIILAVVLVVSAVGKLRAPRASVEAFRDLHVPAPLSGAFAVRALPWAELVLAIALVAAGGWLGVAASVGALLLFGAYLWLVARALGFDRPVDCACFGEFAPGRVTRRTVARNATLVVLAILGGVDASAGVSVVQRITDGRAPWWWLLAAGAAALTTYLIVARAGSSESELQATREIGAGLGDDELEDYERTPTPAVTVVLGDGTETDLRRLSERRAQLLLFVSEGCGSCTEVIASTPQWREQVPELDIRHVVAQAPEDAAVTSAVEPRSVHDADYRVRDSFGMRGTPSALLLGVDGLLAGGPVTGVEAVQDFVREIMTQLRSEPRPDIRDL